MVVQSDGGGGTPAVTSDSALYKVGDWVEIHGLVSDAGRPLNGQTGKVVKPFDPATMRYGVMMKPGDGQNNSVKEQNLKASVQPENWAQLEQMEKMKRLMSMGPQVPGGPFARAPPSGGGC